MADVLQPPPWAEARHVPPASAASSWLRATIAVSIVGFLAAGAGAIRSGGSAGPSFAALLFVATSVHVASTGWLYTLPEVRLVVSHRPLRMVWVPTGLVIAASALAASVSPTRMGWLLIPFFGWQLFHYTKQNLGITCMAARSKQLTAVTSIERRAIVCAGLCGIAGMASHPELLRTGVRGSSTPLLIAATAGFCICEVVGLCTHFARPTRQRPPAFTAIFILALTFSLPVFFFASPYAALGGMTVAHGLQYLVLVGFVASSGKTSGARAINWALLTNVAVIGGGVLALASHLHGGVPAERLVFGAYVGVVMAHFVVDSGLWRQRDPASRAFMAERLTFLRVAS